MNFNLKVSNRYLASLLIAALGVIIAFKATAFNVSEDFLIGVAARNDVSVGARVSFYFKALFLFSFLFISVQYLLQKSNVFYSKTDPKQLHIYLLSGLLLLIAAVLGHHSFATDTAYFIAGVILILQNKTNNKNLITIIGGTLGLYFFLLFFIPFYFAALTSILTFYILNTLKKEQIIRPYFFNGAWILLLSWEAYSLSLHHHLSFSLITFLILFTLLLSLITFWKSSKPYFLPLQLIGWIVLTHYSILTHWNGDFFETANQANALMRIFQFQEWPFIDFLSSHGLSDLGIYPLHVLLYGYDSDLSFYHYQFFFLSLASILLYLFLWKSTQNHWLAFFILFLTPGLTLLHMNKAALALGIFLFYHYQNRKVGHYLILGGLLVFSLLWKIEMGLSSCIALFFLETLYLIQLKKQYPFQNLLKAIGILTFLALGMIFIMGMDVFMHLKDALDYFGASQAHGFEKITNNLNRDFYLYYFIFPVIVFSIGFYQLKKGLTHGITRTSGAILFLSIYYFVNFQRGLVRHSLVEGNEAFINSFFYLLVLLQAYEWLKQKNIPNWTLVLPTLFLLVLSKSHPFTPPMLIQLSDRIANAPNKLEAMRLDPKVRKPADADYTQWLISTYLKENLSSEESFLDFSNHPLLYYFSQKEVPSYFNQYLQNGLTFDHQYRNLATIDTTQIKLVVFRRQPLSWFDQTDGSPNPWRYYPTSQFIYEHYLPDTLIGGFEVWSLKSQVEKPLYRIDTQLHHYELGHESHLMPLAPKMQFKPWDQQSKNHFWKLEIEAPAGTYLKLHYFYRGQAMGSFGMMQDVQKNKAIHYIPISAPYNAYLYPPDSISLEGNMQSYQIEDVSLNYEY